MSTNFKDYLNEQMKNPEFKKEYDARKESGLTQKELAERTGIAQGDISKLENGSANPSIRTLRRLAEGMGMKVCISFVPASGD